MSSNAGVVYTYWVEGTTYTYLYSKLYIITWKKKSVKVHEGTPWDHFDKEKFQLMLENQNWSAGKPEEKIMKPIQFFWPANMCFLGLQKLDYFGLKSW